jgi:hypothetical protein
VIVQKPALCYSDGSPISPGDELEVSYPDIRPIPHRGLVYRLVDRGWGVVGIDIIHKGKLPGVCIVSLPDFAQGQEVRLRRRPESSEHAQQIIERAERQLHQPYNVLFANCEHFTDSCYSGVEGESPTLRAGVLIGSVVLVGIAALSGDRA